jgi:hypothetical protein
MGQASDGGRPAAGFKNRQRWALSFIFHLAVLPLTRRFLEPGIALRNYLVITAGLSREK